MKFEMKKLKNSKFVKLMLFCASLLFLLNLFFQTDMIKEGDLEMPEELATYRADLQNEFDSLNSSVLFHMDESSSMILRVKNAFYQRIDVPNDIQKTYQLSLDNKFDVILVSFMSAVFFYQLIVYEKEEGYYKYLDLYYRNNKLFKWKRFFLCFTLTFLLYLIFFFVRIIIGIILFGCQNVFLSVQCINGMLYCPYEINIICTLAFALMYTMIYILLITFANFLFSEKVNDIKVLITIILTIYIIFYFLQKIPFQSNFVIFKLMTWNTLYMHLNEFHGVAIFNHVWMSHAVSLTWYAIVFLLFIILHQIQFSIHLPIRKKKKKDHSLFQLEIMKLCKGSMISMLLMLTVINILFYHQNFYIDLDQYYANYYLNNLEGKKTEDKEQWINDQLVIFNDLNAEYNILQSSNEINSATQTRMYEINSELNREEGFRIAKEEYEKRHSCFLNTYLLKNILARTDVMFFLAIQWAILLIVFQQILSFDRKNHIDTLLYAIPDYRIKSRMMDEKILYIITSVVTLAISGRIIELSDPFVNSSSVFFKTVFIILILILILGIENIFIRFVSYLNLRK